LIFSAPEYYRSELRRSIKENSGEDVALCFCTIHKGGQGPMTDGQNKVKAIHMEVDSNLSSVQRQCITAMYSSSTQSFPLDIKMRLVPEFPEGPKAEAQAEVLKLLGRQARFLTRSATSKLSPASHCNLTTAQMMNLLRTTSRTYQSTNQTVTPLFHAVSPMTGSKGCLIQYLPQHWSAVLETLTQLQVFVPGFQAPHRLAPSSTSCQIADLEDLNQWFPSKQTTSTANAWEGIVQAGRLQTTSDLGQPMNPSLAHYQVTDNIPKSALSGGNSIF